MQTASIITIGSEIINGNILNTNGQWIAKQLTNLGFRVQSITGVSDDPVRIADTINHLSKFSKYIITTGGLGATHDDVTREAFNTLFDLNWCCDRNSWKKVNEMTSGFGIENIPYESHKQTLIPADSKRLTNENGTAPGFYLHQDNIHYICLPGVPSEMKEIFCKYVCPMITLETPENNEVINIMLYGVTEEEVNSLIGPIMSANEIEYSILVNEGMIKIQIFSKSNILAKDFSKLLTEIKLILSPWCYSFDDLSVEASVSKKLKNKKIYIYDNVLGGICSYLLQKENRNFNLLSEVVIGDNNKSLYNKRDVNIEILNISSQDNLLKIKVTIELNSNMREFQHSISASTSVPLKRLGRQVLFDLQNMLREKEIKINEHVTR